MSRTRAGSARPVVATLKRRLRAGWHRGRLRAALGEAGIGQARILRRLRHVDAPFTQGLCHRDGILYESSGLPTGSRIRALDARNGSEVASRPLAGVWAEGCTCLGDLLYQLTWNDHVVFVHDRATLEPVRSLSYPRAGWGLSTDGHRLFASDGSPVIHELDEQLRELDRTVVTLRGRALSGINDIEIVGELMLANVLYDDWIYVIDRASGEVVAALDCTALAAESRGSSSEHVLNGIAYADCSATLYVTGKCWPWIYEIAMPRPPPGGAD